MGEREKRAVSEAETKPRIRVQTSRPRISEYCQGDKLQEEVDKRRQMESSENRKRFMNLSDNSRNLIFG
jgi:hypothetical protein